MGVKNSIEGGRFGGERMNKRKAGMMTFLVGAFLYLASCEPGYGQQTSDGLQEAVPCSEPGRPWQILVEDLDNEEDIAGQLAFVMVMADGDVVDVDNNEVAVLHGVEVDEEEGRMWVSFGVVYPRDGGNGWLRFEWGNFSSTGPVRLLAWVRDRYNLSVGAHPEDIEMAYLGLERVGESDWWEVVKLGLNPHGILEVYEIDEMGGGLTCVFETHPVVYVERNKHAMHLSLEECNGETDVKIGPVQVMHQVCEVGKVIHMLIAAENNIGDEGVEGTWGRSERLKVLRLGDREVEVDPWGSCHYRDEESRICRVSIRNRGVSRMLWGDE